MQTGLGHWRPLPWLEIDLGFISQLDGKPVCWFNGFVKTTLDLPDDLVKELKLRSVHEGRKLKDVAATALRRGLQVQELAPAAAALPSEGLMLTEDGFPVIRCDPDSPASRMTIKELLALEQQTLLEEDLQRAGISR